MHIYFYNGNDTKEGFLNLMEILEYDEQRMRVMSCIDMIRDSYNGNPTPPLAKPLSGQEESNMNEFRISLSKVLVRIHYFVDREQNRIIILNYYTKPNGSKDKNAYNAKNLKKLQKYIQTQISIARTLQEWYFTNQDDYELLN